MDLNREILRQGLYGFNAVLIGTALVDYFEFDFVNAETGYPDKLHGWIIVIFLSVVLGPVTLFVKLYLQHNVLDPSTPVVLLPFNLIMIVVLLSAKIWDYTMLTQAVLADEGLMSNDGSVYTASRYYGYQALFNGVSRIFLIDGVGSGVLILVGVFLCSRILFASLVGGAFFASLVGLSVFGDHTAYLNAGYAGFNPALAVAAIFYYMVPSWKLSGVAFFLIFITMIITSAVTVILNVMYVCMRNFIMVIISASVQWPVLFTVFFTTHILSNVATAADFVFTDDSSTQVNYCCHEFRFLFRGCPVTVLRYAILVPGNGRRLIHASDPNFRT